MGDSLDARRLLHIHGDFELGGLLCNVQLMSERIHQDTDSVGLKQGGLQVGHWAVVARLEGAANDRAGLGPEQLRLSASLTQICSAEEPVQARLTWSLFINDKLRTSFVAESVAPADELNRALRWMSMCRFFSSSEHLVCMARPSSASSTSEGILTG